MTDNNTQNYILVSGSHRRSDGTMFNAGDKMELSTESAKRFGGRVRRVGGVVEDENENENESANVEKVNAAILDQPPIKVITSINELLDVKALQDLKTLEVAGQNRAGVVKAIDARITEINKVKVG